MSLQKKRWKSKKVDHYPGNAFRRHKSFAKSGGEERPQIASVREKMYISYDLWN